MRASNPSPEVITLLENKKPSITCRHCKSDKTIKWGKYKTQNRGFIQRYMCKSCQKHFVIDDGFYRMKNNERIICQAIDSYLDGLSSRKMRDQLKRHSEIKISHETILRWVRKYALKVLEKTFYKVLEPLGLDIEIAAGPDKTGKPCCRGFFHRGRRSVGHQSEELDASLQDDAAGRHSDASD